MKLLVCFLLFFLGCQNSPGPLEKWVQSSSKVKVLSTTMIIDDLVGQIGGDQIDHIALIEGSMDPHSYELVKGDSEKLALAQVIFYNGLGLEHGGNIKQQLLNHPKAVALGDKIREKNPSEILFEKGQMDPHIWLDVALWSEAIEPIVETLSEMDPQHRDFYEMNGKKTKENLEALNLSIKNHLKTIPPSKRYLVTSHDAFNYFTRRYLQDESKTHSHWKERFCAPEGLAPDGQLSCHDIQLVIDYLIRHQVHIVFSESNISQDSLKKIVSVCKEKGIDVKIADHCLYSDTLDSTQGTYQTMMQHNAKVLYEAWQ